MSATISSVRLTASQQELVSELRSILASGPRNTHQIAQARGDYQAYESHLRDRLFRLEAAGLVVSKNTPRGRFWSLAS